MKSVLWILFVTLSIFSCDPAFSFIESVDGPDGLALTISPTIIQVAITDSIDFTASGGVPPYSYSIQSGSGSINSVSGVYTAPGSIGTALILVSDSYGASSSASVEIVLPPDYSANFSPAVIPALTGSGISESFTIENVGTNNGHFNIYWTAYISTDSILGTGSDYVIDSGYISELDAGTISSPISFTGTWLSTEGSYYLIVEINSDDDINTGNNDASSSVYMVTVPDIDYQLTFSPAAGSVTEGDGISENFTLENVGLNNGSDTIYWTAYISTDSTLGIGDDYPIATGSVGALDASLSQVISFSGIWYTTSGSYYLLIRAIVNDDANLANNEVSSELYTLSP
jgi:hypothetical protein